MRTSTYAHGRDESTFLVLDAQNVADGPVVEVKLSPRVSCRFHGVGIPDGV